MSKSMHYRPEIDGLRALAVLPVMLFHAGIGPLSGGYVGVDIFFVISGFLITTIIHREIIGGKFTYAGFYERRARRILPALYFVVLVSILPAWFILVPTDLIDYSETIISAVGFSSNIILWLQSGYFDPSAELKPLLHTWSLAVEEQFYLFFPPLLMLLYHFIKKQALATIVLILVMSLMLSHWGAYNKPTATYYLLPTRAWELLVGSVIALLTCTNHSSPIMLWLQKHSNTLSLAGLILILGSMLAFNEHTPFPSLWALIPVTGAALLILFSKPKTIAHTLLSNRFFVGIGLISYSAYLWHQPVYAFARQQALLDPTIGVMTFAFTLSLALAYLSWRYVEKPFRNRERISSQKVWGFSIIGGLLLVAFGAVIIKNQGFENRFSLPAPLTEATFDLPARSNGWCFYSVDTDKSLPVGEQGFKCHLGNKTNTPKVLLFGDSYAAMYEPFWDTVAQSLSIGVNSVTTNWCHPSFSDNFWWQSATPARAQCLLNREFVASSLDQYDVIILSAVWHVVEEKGLINEVHTLIEQLTKEQGLKVVVMAQPTLLTRSSLLGSVYRNGHLIKQKSDAIVQAINATFEGMAEQNKNLLFLNRKALFETRENQILLDPDNIPYSWDGGHISIHGSLSAGQNFIQKKEFLQLERFLESDSN